MGRWGDLLRSSKQGGAALCRKLFHFEILSRKPLWDGWSCKIRKVTKINHRGKKYLIYAMLHKNDVRFPDV